MYTAIMLGRKGNKMQNISIELYERMLKITLTYILNNINSGDLDEAKAALELLISSIKSE